MFKKTVYFGVSTYFVSVGPKPPLDEKCRHPQNLQIAEDVNEYI
jgi:hypothetical protein